MIRCPLLAVLLAVSALPAFAQRAPSDVPLTDARRDHTTRLVVEGALDGKPAPVPPASMFRLVHYTSPAGSLVAYVSPDPNLRRSVEHGAAPSEPRRYPALVWCHGGFGGIGPWLWEKPQFVSSYRARDFVVLCPAWRGENDNPGRFEMLYGEVQDARAAIDYVASLPYVDPERVYIAGHSSGGTIAMLTALTSPKRLRAAFAFGGSPDLFHDIDGQQDLAGAPPPFARRNPRELFLRSPTFFVEHLKVPTWYFEGEDSVYRDDALDMGKRATKAKAPLQVRIVAGGDHFNILEPIGELLAKELASDTKPAVVLNLSPDAVRDAFEQHPNAADHFATAGLDLIDSDPRRARALFDRALEVNPGHIDALVNRGVLHERQGRLKPALTDLNEALGVAPDDFYALYNRGIVHHRLENYEGAMADFNRAVALNPQDSWAYSARALVRADTNDPQGAREDLEHALLLDPDNTDARSDLANLQGQQQIAAVTNTAVGIAAPVALLAAVAAAFFFLWRAKTRAAKGESRIGYRDGAAERRQRRPRRPIRKPSKAGSEPYDAFELVDSDPATGPQADAVELQADAPAPQADAPELHDSKEGSED